MITLANIDTRRDAHTRLLPPYWAVSSACAMVCASSTTNMSGSDCIDASGGAGEDDFAGPRRILLTPQEADAVMPRLEKVFLENQEGLP